MSTYVFDQTWQKEHDRLTALESLFDPASRRHLASLGAEIHSPVPSGGSETWTRGSVEQLADKMVATGLTTAADIELFLTLTLDPVVYYAPPLMVSAWGQRTAA